MDGTDIVTECTGISVPWGVGGSSSDTLSLVLVYRPPRDPGSMADQGNTGRLCDMLKKLEGTVITLGDYNLPGVDWDRGWSASEGERLVVDTFADKFWTQHIRGPTHVGGNTLDLLTSSNPDMVVDVEKLGYLGTGDHMMIETSIAGPARVEESTEMVPDWQKADMEGMKQAIADINWAEEFGDRSGKECMEIVYSVLERETERFVPS